MRHGLRRGCWGAIACIALSCAPAQPPRAPAAATEAFATPQLAWASADAEVWAWRVSVRGELIGGAGSLRQCTVEIAGKALPAITRVRDFALEVELEPGPNVLRARCRDESGAELRTPALRYVEQLADVPTARAGAELRGGELVLEGRGSAPSEHSQAELTEYTWLAPGDGQGEQVIGTGIEQPLAPPAKDGDYVYTLQVRDVRGARDRARVLVRVEDGVASVPDAAVAAPIEDAVVYGVLPPLFAAPPLALAGVRAALDRLADLGVSVLWLAPVFDTPPGNYGYAVTDFRAVRRDYGSADDLAALVRDAHARGLRVLLDLPANDSSDQHPYFVQAEQLRARSHYFSFYARDALGAATHYFDWVHLPNFAYDNAEVGRFMLEASLYWLRDLDADGFRVDAAWGVRERSPAYFPMWSAALRRVAPAALLIAEASARDAYYRENGFDAAYDWSEGVGQWAWRDVFSQGPGLVTRLHAAVMQSFSAARPGRVLRFLNNNDTGQRFITRHGEAMTRAATVALLTLPGIPCLYSFDEIGAEYEPYGQLQPIAAGENEGLLSFHKTLIHLRRATPALRDVGFSPLAVDGRREIYAYVRSDTAATQFVLVALHFAAGAERVTLAIPERFGPLRDGRLRDALSGATVRAQGGRLAIELGDFDAKVFVLDTSAVAGSPAAKPRPRRLSSR